MHQEGKPIEASLMVQLEDAKVTMTAKTATKLALHYLLAADRFAERIGEVESENVGRPFGVFWEEIFQNALGVATLSVATLECYANELFFENSAIAPPLNPVAAGVVAEALDRKPILEKYAAVLAIRAGKQLDKNRSEFESVRDLINLRNAVTHFRPEWFGEQTKHEKLSQRLRGKFQTSPFLPDDPVFPRAWASHTFAKWAVTSTVAFAEHFSVEASIPNPFAKFRECLKSLSTGTP